MKLSRREFLRLAGGAGVAAGLGSLAGLTGCESRRMRDLRQKVVFLGFDGVSPSLLEPWAVRAGITSVMDNEGFSVGIDLPTGEEMEHVVRSVVTRLRDIALELTGLGPEGA